MTRCTRCAVAVLIFVADLLAAPSEGLGQWKIEEQSVGEQIPGWLAWARSANDGLELLIEFSCDGPCVPVVSVRSRGLFSYRREPSGENVRGEASLTFFPKGQLVLPGYAASGSIYELLVDRESFPILLDLFGAAERVELSIPGRDRALTGILELRGAASAAKEARTKCEARFLEDNDFVFQDSAERRVQEWEVAMLSPTILRIARNEIYARRGYRFSDPLLLAYFETKPWYAPGSAPIALTAVEEANVALIRSFESSDPKGRRQ